MFWPLKALGGMCAAAIQEALARGGSHRAVAIEPCEAVLDGPHRLDAPGR
jgi:hypothetical protein